MQEIKCHPFFKGINWNNLRNTTPPYKPPVDKADFRLKDPEILAILTILKKLTLGYPKLLEERAKVKLNRT